MRRSRIVKHGATIYLRPGRRESLEVLPGGKALFLDGNHAVKSIVLHQEATAICNPGTWILCDTMTIHGGLAGNLGTIALPGITVNRRIDL